MYYFDLDISDYTNYFLRVLMERYREAKYNTVKNFELNKIQ